MPDTLNDRIERHEALAEEASPSPWRMVSDGFDSTVEDRDSLYIASYSEDAGILRQEDAAHIAANDPATIKAFCAVAKAAEDANEQAIKAGTVYSIPVAAALAALYDALGGER